MTIKPLLILFTGLLLGACVPQRIMEETKGKLTNCETELNALKTSSAENETKLAELKERMTKTEKELEQLRKDSAINGANYRAINDKYIKLNVLNDQLMDKYQKQKRQIKRRVTIDSGTILKKT
jgi:septal ring factor EnvC (AmiA/AmiB activator)